MGATGYTTDARAVTSVEGRTGAVDVAKADVGLGSVDNTADADKPVSSATQTALNSKASSSHNHDGTYATAAHTHPAGSWVAISSFGANMTAEASGSFYVPGQRTEPNDLARLRGRIQTAVNYTAGATICTLDASYRPAKDVVFNFRSGGTGAAAGFMTITTLGVVSFSTAITVSSATAWFHLDAISYSLVV